MAAVSFGGTACTAVSLENSDVEAFDGWAVVDKTFGRAGCPDPFVDQLDHFDDALALGDTGFDTIPDFYGIGRLCRCAVHHHSTGATEVRRR